MANKKRKDYATFKFLPSQLDRCPPIKSLFFIQWNLKTTFNSPDKGFAGCSMLDSGQATDEKEKQHFHEHERRKGEVGEARAFYAAPTESFHAYTEKEGKERSFATERKMRRSTKSGRRRRGNSLFLSSMSVASGSRRWRANRWRSAATITSPF